MLRGCRGDVVHVGTTIEIADARIALEDEGEGLPLLLLHGFPATRHLWSRVIPRLAQAHYRVIVPDLVGYGESDCPAAARIDMASQADWMLQLVEQLGLRRVTLIAHDVGTAAEQPPAPGSSRAEALALGVVVAHAFLEDGGYQSYAEAAAQEDDRTGAAARSEWPALLTRMSRRPKRRRTSLTSFSASRETSPFKAAPPIDAASAEASARERR